MRKGIIARGTGIAVMAAAGLVLSSLNASALVLTEKSEAQKLRADIQKQQHGYIACLVKAATNCEKSGAGSASECDLNNGTATPPADSKGKFAADIAKCDAKLNFLKKAKTLDASTGYTGIGCPGDSDNGTAGDQPYGDMSSYQAGVPATTKSQIQALALVVAAFSGCSSISDPKEQNKCQAAEVKRISSYAFAIQKCQLACENDYKNKKGNGGPSDSTGACSLNASATSGTGDVNFNTCIDKAYGKAIKKTPFPPMIAGFVLPQLATALNDANNDVNNENDCP